MFDSNAPPPPYTPRPNATSQIARVIFLSMVFVVVYNFVVFVRTLLVLGSLASELLEAKIDCVSDEVGLKCGLWFRQIYQTALQDYESKDLFSFHWFPDIHDGVALFFTYLVR
ncbi:hypothetical protein C8J55DRAFT_564335 [Lentinula edodes]|uniref:Uncharacterized protein n=1 Tax=Lentinula lateritia TaxID=40482 RepID=A0A9W9DGN6_9AGAR|nr:hypothetical protein C8J55DRAFT_564335 [Lentinula edodes]